MSNGLVLTGPRISALVAGLAACMSIPAFAQPTNGANSDQQNGIAAAAATDQLAEVVVTAEKRTENLQSLPQTITAVTGSEIPCSRVSRTSPTSHAWLRKSR